MDNRLVIRLSDYPGLKDRAANWFHEKWGIPLEAYLESMDQCLTKKTPVPQWYMVLDGEGIVAGVGVIENDFHERKDLTPNVCALYVEEAYRCQGLAGKLLQFAREDMARRGVYTLYLLTDHESFYERYGWQFLCMVQGDGEEEPARMYMYQS